MSDAAVITEEPWVPTADSFGARLVLLRHHLNLTQVQAGKLCGLDDGSWSNWERGGRPRAMDLVVDAIAKATGCSRSWLMWGSETMYKWTVIDGDGADVPTAQGSLPFLSTFA